MAKFYRGSNFNVKIAKDYFIYLNWMKENLADDYHVLIEFTASCGKQIDILIIHSNGIYCLEVKNNVRWSLITPNSNWKYVDRETNKVKKDPRMNPFNQVKSASDSFLRWVLENRKQIFNQALGRKLRIYPYVISPEQQENPEIIQDDWVVFLGGESEFNEIFKRKWNQLEINEEGIEFIIEQNFLDEISVDDLQDMFEKKDWWMEKKHIEGYKKAWSKYYNQKLNFEEFSEINKKYIDLSFERILEGSDIKQEVPLTEIKDYSIPRDLTLFPFFLIPGSSERIINDFLDRKGFDFFEKPYAHWRAVWQSGEDVFGNLERISGDLKEHSLDSKEFNVMGLIENLKKQCLWILGNSGSGKSFTAKYIWNLLIEEYIRGDQESIPLLIDSSNSEFNKIIEEVFDKPSLTVNKETLFIELATYNWTHLKLPQAENLDKLKIQFLIDSVDETTSLEGLKTIINFAKINNFEILLFCREDFFFENSNLVHKEDSVFRIKRPTEYFRNSILHKEAQNYYSHLKSETKQILNSPIFLSLFTSLQENEVTEEFFTEVQGFMLIFKDLFRINFAEFGISFTKEVEEEKIKFIFRSTSEYSYLDYINDEKKLNVLNSFFHKNFRIKDLLIKSGIITRDLNFVHNLYREFFLSVFIYSDDIEITKIRQGDLETICKNISELQRLKHPENEKSQQRRIQKLFSHYLKINPLKTAELFFDGSLDKKSTSNLINHVIDILKLRRSSPRKNMDFSTFLQVDNSDINIFPIEQAIRIFSNPFVLKLLKKDDMWETCYENLIYSLLEFEFESNPHFNLSGIKDFNFLKKLAKEPILDRVTVLRILSKTKNYQAIKLILEICNEYEMLDHRHEIIKALREIGSELAEEILKELNSCSDLNIQSFLIQALKHIRSSTVISKLEDMYKKESDFTIKMLCAESLNFLDNSYFGNLILPEFSKMELWKKKKYIEILSSNPSEKLRKTYIQLIKSNDDFFNEVIAYKIFSQTENRNTIEQVLKLIRRKKSTDLISLNTLISISNNNPNFSDKIIYLIDTILGDDNSKKISILSKIKNEKSVNKILNLIENNELYSNKDLFFQLTLLGNTVVKPVLKKLEETEIFKFSFELIRLLGLLCFSETLENFPEKIKCKDERLKDIIMWTIFRIGERNNEILYNKLSKQDHVFDKRVIIASASLRKKIFIKPLRKYWQTTYNTEEEVISLLYLLASGDEQIAARAIAIIDGIKDLNLRIPLLITLSRIENIEIENKLNDILLQTNSLTEKHACLIGLSRSDDELIIENWIDMLKNLDFNQMLISLEFLMKTNPNPIFLYGIKPHLKKISEAIVKKVFVNLYGDEVYEDMIKDNSLFKDILNINYDSKEYKLLKESLETKRDSKSLVLKFRKNVQPNQAPIIPYVDTFIPLNSLERVFYYINDQYSINLERITKIVEFPLENHRKRFLEFILEENLSSFYLIIFVTINKIVSVESLSFIINFLNSKKYGAYLREIAWDSLEIQLSLNPKLFLKEISKFNEVTIFNVIRRMDISNSEVNNVCKSFAKQFENPKISIAAGMKLNDNEILIPLLREKFAELKDEEFIKEISNHLGLVGASGFITNILNHLNIVKKRETKIVLLTAIRRIGDVSNIEQVIKILENSKTRPYYTEILEILKKNICTITLNKILSLYRESGNYVKNKDILTLIIQSKNVKFANELVDCLNEFDFDDYKYDIDKLEIFLEEQLERYLENLKNTLEEELFINQIEKLLLKSGKSKYIEKWLEKIEKSDSSQSIRWTKIYSKFQREKIFYKLENSEEKFTNLILDKIAWSADIYSLQWLLDYKAKQTNPDILNIITEIVNVILREIV